jgi:hypothetical protein
MLCAFPGRDTRRPSQKQDQTDARLPRLTGYCLPADPYIGWPGDRLVTEAGIDDGSRYRDRCCRYHSRDVRWTGEITFELTLSAEQLDERLGGPDN